MAPLMLSEPNLSQKCTGEEQLTTHSPKARLKPRFQPLEMLSETQLAFIRSLYEEQSHHTVEPPFSCPRHPRDLE